MEAVGVDGALLVSPWTLYRFDAGYTPEVSAKHPGRFGPIKPFDPRAETVSGEIAEWVVTPGVIGVRIMKMGDATTDDPGLNRIAAGGARHCLPVNMPFWGKFPRLGQLARRNPNTRVAVDHLDLWQPFEPPAPPESFADLGKIPARAEYDNVAIKTSGACTQSYEPFPYADIWEPLGQVFEAYGFECCLRGTDWTRAVGLLTHEQGVETSRATAQLSDSERAALMGGSLAHISNCSPTVAPRSAP